MYQFQLMVGAAGRAVMKASEVAHWIHDKECCDPLAKSWMGGGTRIAVVSVLWLSFLVYTLLTWEQFQFW